MSGLTAVGERLLILTRIRHTLPAHALLESRIVLCRIEIRRESGAVIVRLAGRLTGAQVPDLLAVCAQGGGTTRVELDELIAADVVGVDALRRVEEDGAKLIGLPEYLRFELDSLARQRRGRT